MLEWSYLALKHLDMKMYDSFFKAMPDSTSFELETPDGKSTMVKLKMPIRDMLSSIVEVYGSVDEKCNIQCVNYATFEEDMINNFGKQSLFPIFLFFLQQTKRLSFFL